MKYEVENHRVTWDTAQAWCRDHNANLTSVHSEDELNELRSMLK